MAKPKPETLAVRMWRQLTPATSGKWFVPDMHGQFMWLVYSLPKCKRLDQVKYDQAIALFTNLGYPCTWYLYSETVAQTVHPATLGIESRFDSHYTVSKFIYEFARDLYDERAYLNDD